MSVIWMQEVNMIRAPGDAENRLPARTRAVYAERLRRHRRHTRTITQNPTWNETPYFVSIETLALCNAACEFCPYPTLTRKGQKMPDELFYKIVDDLAAKAPAEVPNFTLNRVSEPLLDTRTFEFGKYIAMKFPSAKVHRVTNASALTDKMIDKLLDQGNTGYIKISFNDHRPAEYEKTMALPFERTYRNAKRLHERVAAGEVLNYVMIGRVGDGSDADADFVEWCKREFPLFHPGVSPRFDWLGYTHSLSFGVLGGKCSQWYELHFLVNGKEALCCIDSTGEHGRGDVTKENAYDIYMHPSRQAMRSAGCRRDIEACKSCTALV
jgi:hypothetical protein